MDSNLVFIVLRDVIQLGRGLLHFVSIFALKAFEIAREDCVCPSSPLEFPVIILKFPPKRTICHCARRILRRRRRRKTQKKNQPTPIVVLFFIMLILCGKVKFTSCFVAIEKFPGEIFRLTLPDDCLRFRDFVHRQEMPTFFIS